MTNPAPLIVYDWNGTLLDDAHLSHRCFNIVMSHIGRAGFSFENWSNTYDMPLAKMFRALGLTEEEIEIALNNIGPVFHDSYEEQATGIPLRDGASPLLSRAHKHGITQIILSNHIIAPIRAMLARLGVEHFMNDVIAYPSRGEQFRHETKGQKLHRFINDNHYDPNRTVIIGDSPEEAHIARDQGLTSILITGGYVAEPRLRAAEPDHLIHSLTELPAILEKRGFFA